MVAECLVKKFCVKTFRPKTFLTASYGAKSFDISWQTFRICQKSLHLDKSEQTFRQWEKLANPDAAGFRERLLFMTVNKASRGPTIFFKLCYCCCRSCEAGVSASSRGRKKACMSHTGAVFGGGERHARTLCASYRSRAMQREATTLKA